MISITVHHHNPHSSPMAPEQHQQQQPEQLKQQQVAAGSNVQVQYLARYFRSNRRPPNSSSSSSNNNSSFVTPDNTNSTNKLNSLISPKPSSASSQEERKLAAPEVPLKLQPGNSNHRHSRSISFVINPQFSPDNSEAANHSAALCRRRSLPRLSRRARQAPPKVHLDDEPTKQVPDTCSHISSCSSSSSGRSSGSSQSSSELELTCSATLGDSCCSAADSGATNAAQVKQVESLAPSVSTPESRLRQTGVLLRQISDEFFRSRRRTI